MKSSKYMLVRLIVALNLLLAGFAAAQNSALPTAGQMLAAAQEQALNLVLTAARDQDPYMRANAIEALDQWPQRVLPLAELGLQDNHAVVRFTALVTIGKLRAATHRQAAEALLKDPDPSVRAAACFAAHQCGSPADISPMAGLLMSDRADVRANTAMLLGLMGDPSADPMLEIAARAPLTQAVPVRKDLTRLQIAEARIRLGQRQVMDAVRAAVYSSFPEMRLVSVGMLGELGDVSQMEDALLEIFNNPQEVLELRLGAAAVLARYGRSVVVKSVLDSLPTILSAATMTEPALRNQAAVTLGAVELARARIRPELLPSDPPIVLAQFQDTQATAALIGLLNDPDPRVRLSAAAAVLRAGAQAQATAVHPG
ncbi:MAG: HEAT repeat domain-containing protein [Phycisphaeraceae bacterium]|nr:HEAT repeat domain-containing protein [Phycisphaeraceae bacterium]